MKKKKSLLSIAVMLSMLSGFQGANAQDVHNWTDLQQAIVNGTTPINITGNITTEGNLGTLGGSSVNINGGGFNINGNGNQGITISNDQSLNIDKVGLESSNGFNRFTNSGDGGVIYNSGTVTIENSTLSGNSAHSGGAITNASKASLTINNALFASNNAADCGGAIINNSGDLVITNSTFIGNSANSWGGALYNNIAETTIVDSSFYGNSGSEGGAITSIGTLNIIADSKNVEFTGNTRGDGTSNAIYSFGNTINLNASDSASVVFNDAISVRRGTNIININSDNVQINSDLNNPVYAQTTGTVEFNNNVGGHIVNLYNGTLKLGHHAEETITVNGTQQTVAESFGSLDSSVNFKVHGGTLSLQDGGARTTNIGNVTLENDLQLAIDAAVTGTDMITANGFNAGGHKILISDINLGSSTSYTGTAISTDSNIYNNVGLSSDIKLSGDGLANTNVLVSYNNTTGNLSAGASTLKDAVNGTEADRIYTMSTDEIVTSGLGTMGGDGSTLTINGNGYDIIADADEVAVVPVYGIELYNNRTLNINNVGKPADKNSKGFNGFNTSPNGGVISNYGAVNVTNSKFSENSASRVGGVIANSGIVTIAASIFTGNSAGTYGGAIYNDGTTTITDSTFSNNTASDRGGAIYNYGTTNIIASINDTVFTGNTANGVSNALYQDGGTTNLNASDSASIIFNDGIDGAAGTININNTGITMADGATDAPTTGVVEFNNTVKNNTVNLYNGTLKFGTNTQNNINYAGTFDDSVDFNYHGGIVSLQNNGINSANLGNLTLNKDMDLRLDADLAAQKMDTITATSFTDNGNNINISNINVLSATTQKSFSISPIGEGMDSAVKDALVGAIQYTGSDIAYGSIYKYTASYDPTTAMFNFGLAGGGGGTPGYDSFNPSVMAAPVAAQLGGYLNQLNAYDNAFRNMDMYMLMTKEQRQAMKLRNKYASIANNDIVFDPTVSQYENKAGWFRPFATFENVSLNNGPKVSNVAYGSYFGADSELYDLGHGWDGMWGVYAGYNGSHQAYDGVSIYQNGGTLGAVGMAYKGNFFTGLTANVGANAGEASTMFGREDFAMLMSGVASKTGYNIELAKGKFIIQPNFLMSYSFINTFDYKNAAGVSIGSDPLHAIQLEPGIKFIGNLKNGWQPYAGVSVVWNIMDRTQFTANDVSLPNLSIDPFVKYGVGVRKAWGERFSGFFQTYITNGGRNGVGLQAGFRWTLGKTQSSNQKASGTIPELPKTKVTLNNIK